MKAVLKSILVLAASAGFVFAGGERGKSGTQKVERSIAATPAVAVKLCVNSGDVTVRGWNKNEVLARSTEVSNIELKRADAGNLNGAAAKLTVWLSDRTEGQPEKNGCQAFGDVQLMVPHGASVYLQTGDGAIDVAEVSAVYARSQTGEIAIRSASHWIEAVSFSGEVAVENSTGRVLMKSVSGMLTASNLRPNDANDCFEAATISGDIELEKVAHNPVTVKTANGKINLSGPLAPQGRYTFNTTTSDVTLNLPANASFKLNARVARDREITSDFPLSITIEDPLPVISKKMEGMVVPAKPDSQAIIVEIDPKNKVTKVRPVVDPVVVKQVYSLRRITAVHGSADALINVSSFGGTIHLTKSGN